MIQPEKSSLPREVFETLGVEPRGVTLIPIVGKGEANEVVLLESDRGRFIVRLLSDEKNTQVYLKEQWCMEQASLRGVPCARCVGIGKGAGKAFMIQTAIAAVDGADWLGDRAYLWKELGRHAAKINSIPVQGFGWELRNPALADFGGTWKGTMDWSVDSLFGEGFFQKVGILSKDQEQRVRARLEQMYSWSFEPRLSHGNLAPKNCMIDDAGTVHVIDWGTAGACRAPHQDLSDILTWNWGKKYEQAFLEGYGIDREDYCAMRNDLDTLVLHRLLDSIRWAADNKPEWRKLDFVVYSEKKLLEFL